MIFSKDLRKAFSCEHLQTFWALKIRCAMALWSFSHCEMLFFETSKSDLGLKQNNIANMWGIIYIHCRYKRKSSYIYIYSEPFLCMTFAKKYRFRFIDVAPLYCKKKNNGDFTQNKKSQGIFISDFSWRRNPPFQPDKTFHNNSSS